MGFSGGTFQLGLSRRAGTAAAADAAGGRVHPQAHAQPVRRGAVRAVSGEPYFQYFCGEVVFQHELPFDRSSLTRWRQRLGEEQIVALLQESLSVAHRTGAIESRDLERVVVDSVAWRQIADRHILDHTAAKRADLSHREISCLKGWALTPTILSDRRRLLRPPLDCRASGFVQSLASQNLPKQC